MSASSSDVQFQAQGLALVPGSSRRMEVLLSWQTGGPVTMYGPDNEILVTGMPCQIETIPGGPVLVHMPGKWIVEIQKREDVASLTGKRAGGWLSALERWHPNLFVLSGLVLLSGFALWRWGLDLLVAIAIYITPPAVFEYVDQSQLAGIDVIEAHGSQLSVEKKKEIQLIFQRLIAHAPKHEWANYRLEFRSIEDIGPNAFALPGGTVVVTDSLINEFPDPDVIAGVLGHELAHVTQTHGLKQLYRAFSTHILIALIIGDTGPILENLVLEGNVLLSLSYSRDHEEEADRLGTALSEKAGFDRTALAEFFEKLEEENLGGNGMTWMSTHPGHKSRIDAIRNYSAGGQ